MPEFEPLQKDFKGSLAQRFEQCGWHLEPGVLDHDLAMQVQEFLIGRLSHLQDLFEEWVKAHGADRQTYGSHQEQLSRYLDLHLPSDLQHFLIGEFDLETRLDTKIIEILSTDWCRTFICSYFETDHYYIHYPPMIRFKVADGGGSVVPAHQDFAYNTHLTDFATVWVPLVDINEECGGLMVYEGSHLIGEVEHSASGAWENKALIDLAEYPSRHILMNLGDALLFPPKLVHSSAPHRGERTRFSIDFRLFRRAGDTLKSFYNPFTGAITRQD